MNQNNNKSIIQMGGNYLIYISNNPDAVGKYKRLGDFNNILEIEYNPNDNSINSIYCPLCCDICEYDLKVPPYNDLKKIDKNIITSTKQNYFRIFYTHNNLDLFLESVPKIKSYYTNGRIDYFYDENMELCNIRIKDLTEEEYNVIHNEEYDVGHYMKVSFDEEQSKKSK